MNSKQFKQKQQYKCMKCGRFVGNTNLGGYMTDKVSKRGRQAYCQRCVDDMLTERKEQGNGNTS
jgi:DNA-directed RNA polymerase subunit RPC12/RpoP